ncbi:MAG: hypothetical protein APF77_04165 [Clostridia bacterium BRH_c25]|nr:MAG: hypothetical protein APF77_04165 [Clostridia bacterium BRH_c25]
MRLKAFACDVLARELYYWSALSVHIIDIELISSVNHEYPKRIHKLLQEKIDALEGAEQLYDYILLGFGLCGNVLEGLESRGIPIVVPRAHDCITVFMGSKEAYDNYFNYNTGTMYYVDSWIERNGLKKERRELDSLGLGGTYEELAAKYGEENAEYLIGIANGWKAMYKKALYLTNDLTDNDFSQEIEALAKDRNWDFARMKSDHSLIKRMVSGDWEDSGFLVIPPDSMIRQSVDSRIVDYICDHECKQRSCSG